MRFRRQCACTSGSRVNVVLESSDTPINMCAAVFVLYSWSEQDVPSGSVGSASSSSGGAFKRRGSFNSIYTKTDSGWKTSDVRSPAKYREHVSTAFDHTGLSPVSLRSSPVGTRRASGSVEVSAMCAVSFYCELVRGKGNISVFDCAPCNDAFDCLLLVPGCIWLYCELTHNTTTPQWMPAATLQSCNVCSPKTTLNRRS
jgi:hypothetical protein